MKESAARIEKNMSMKMEDLLRWRSSEIDSLIRQSLFDQGTSESSSDNDVQLTSSNDDNATVLQESIRKHQTVNRATKEKIVALAHSKADLLTRMGKVEEDLSIVNGKLNDIACKIESEKLRHANIISETSNYITSSIQSIVRLRCDIEQQVKDATEQYSRELRRVMVVALHFIIVVVRSYSLE